MFMHQHLTVMKNVLKDDMISYKNVMINVSHRLLFLVCRLFISWYARWNKNKNVAKCGLNVRNKCEKEVSRMASKK